MLVSQIALKNVSLTTLITICYYLIYHDSELNINLDRSRFTEKIRLFSTIVPSESTFNVLTSKIEVKLKKADLKLRWDDLESGTVKLVTKPAGPISNREMKNWNEIQQNWLTQVRSYKSPSAKNGPYVTISVSD